MNYTIKPETTLRDVYLTYLIALDNQEFLRQNNLNSTQVLAMRNYYTDTWQDFQNLRRIHEYPQ